MLMVNFLFTFPDLINGLFLGTVLELCPSFSDIPRPLFVILHHLLTFSLLKFYAITSKEYEAGSISLPNINVRYTLTLRQYEATHPYTLQL